MAFVVVLSLLLVLYSSTVQLLPAFNVLYVPISIAAVAVLGYTARRRRMDLDELGLDRDSRSSGIKVGLAVAVVVAGVLGIAIVFPVFHGLFEDERLADIGPGLVAYRAFVRIPLGTALLEEFAFRGVLLAAWRRTAGDVWAIIGSSVVFGFWHIRPALDLIDANGSSADSMERIALLVLAVAGTAAAGVFFAILRIRTNSLLAPYVAHTAINSLSLLAAAFITDLI